MQTVRDAVFAVLSSRGVRRLYSNPGSTEVSLLADLPADITFILGLHEGSVVGMATGDALVTGAPAVALLHTTAGLGNAVGAIATARANRAPLVVIVGQQDRRHLVSEPFLTGRLTGLAGDYPLIVLEPARAQDLPSLVARAFVDAIAGAGPVVVIAPMDDWGAQMDSDAPLASPTTVIVPPVHFIEAPQQLVEAISASISPVVVVGSRMTSHEDWRLASDLAGTLGCPIWQESHASRACVDHDDPHFAGHLPADRRALRTTFEGHDLVIVLGGLAFRQYLFAEGGFVNPGTRVAVVSDSVDEIARSAADIGCIAPPGPLVRALLPSIRRRDDSVGKPLKQQDVVQPSQEGPLHPSEIFQAITSRDISNLTVIEESPSSRSMLVDAIAVSDPLGFFTPAMGGLGFAIPAATGMALARPDRTVIAIVGDGASLYNFQALWSAQKYGARAIFIIMNNGRYAVMDRLAKAHDSTPVWPAFEDIDFVGLSRSLGCPARRVSSSAELSDALDEALTSSSPNAGPMVLEVAIQ